MNQTVFDLQRLGHYLQRDARELEKLSSQGRIPGRRVGGEWRFNRDEINRWLEQQLGEFSDQQLENVERGVGTAPGRPRELLEPLVTPLMDMERIAIPLLGRTVPSVLHSLLEVANRSWQVYMPDEVLVALRSREEMCSTAIGGGVAVPHPRRPMPDAIGQSMVTFGRAFAGIPFGGPKRELTDLFFLILCQEESLHLQVLARLARMFQRDDFLVQLRETEHPADALACIKKVEDAVIADSASP